VASYCGMKVLAVALITNKAVLDYDSEDFPNHEEVIETANQRAVVVEKLIIEFVERIRN
jgi:purine-nucleoside phosphorylase